METLSFLAWPFATCLLLILIHTWFGVHILERGIIFVDLALAQFISIGIALSLLADGYRMPLAVLFALGGALIMTFTRRVARHVNVEAFIGVLYIFSFGVCSLILDRTAHGMEEFKSILNGNILWVTPEALAATALLYGAVGLLHWFMRKRFHDLTFNGEGPLWVEFLFFASFALVLVKSVMLAGILQVFSFLVVPALLGRLFFRSTGKILVAGWTAGTLVSSGGIALSHLLDLPTAPLIVAGLALLFFAALAAKAFIHRNEASA
ncbi:MAG: metal ABC transporter permease [Desulfuromonadaceae bacterium]